MSDVQNSEEPKANRLRPVIWGVALIGVAAFVYVIFAATFKPSDDGGMIAFRRGALAKLEIPGELKPRDERQPEKTPEMSPPAQSLPEIPLIDASGKAVKLSDYRGQVLVVNFWATWCAPCKVEMPTLNALAAAYAVQPVKVLAVSVDRERDREKAKVEMAPHGALTLLFDDNYKMAFGMTPPAAGMPTTVIFDRKGVERARISGDADWNSKDARALVEALLKE
jgi:thiol-disulfide isomerase/thioredoxin